VSLPGDSTHASALSAGALAGGKATHVHTLLKYLVTHDGHALAREHLTYASPHKTGVRHARFPSLDTTRARDREREREGEGGREEERERGRGRARDAVVASTDLRHRAYVEQRRAHRRLCCVHASPRVGGPPPTSPPLSLSRSPSRCAYAVYLRVSPRVRYVGRG